MYIRWLIFSCDLLSLYPAAHFLSMWFNGMMAIIIIIYPTPPLGQDMTQGQFFKVEFNRFEFRVFLLLD